MEIFKNLGRRKPSLMNSPLKYQARIDNAPVGSVGAPGGILPNAKRAQYRDPAENLLRGLSMAPIVGDIAGPLADIRRWQGDPESRTLGNAAMMALGVLPAIPSLAYLMSQGGDAATGMARMARAKGQGGSIGGGADYMMSHRPMADAGGASRLHDLTPAFGEDIYGSNALQYFGSGDKREGEVLRILKSLRGNPDAEVTVYRGVPDDAPDTINHGDWVTLSKKVAQDYGPKVVAQKVKARDITSWADSLLEFGFFPEK